MLGLNRELRFPTLRRNYGFLSLSYTDFLGLEIEPDISVFHNLDDDSGTVSVRLEKAFGQGSIGLYITSAYGNDGAEFKLRSPRQSGVGYFTLHF